MTPEMQGAITPAMTPASTYPPVRPPLGACRPFLMETLRFAIVWSQERPNTLFCNKGGSEKLALQVVGSAVIIIIIIEILRKS